MQIEITSLVSSTSLIVHQSGWAGGEAAFRFYSCYGRMPQRDAVVVAVIIEKQLFRAASHE
jgi:hypothetical protein